MLRVIICDKSLSHSLTAFMESSSLDNEWDALFSPTKSHGCIFVAPWNFTQLGPCSVTQN